MERMRKRLRVESVKAGLLFEYDEIPRDTRLKMMSFQLHSTYEKL